MKKITFIGILTMVIIAGCVQNKPIKKTILGMGTDYYLFPETLKGKVKEVKEQNFWAIEKDGKITKGDPITWKMLDSIGSTKTLVAYFDSTGLLTRYDLLDENNAIRYSDIGTIVNGKYTRWESKMKDSLYQYAIPRYDNLGYLIGGSGYRPVKDTLVNKQILTHDGKGNYTKIEYFNPKNQRTSHQELSLNLEGKVIEVKFFNKSDSLVMTFINTYNDKGSMIKQQVFVEKPKSTQTWDMKDLSFDDNGNCLEWFSNVNNGKYKILTERSYIYY